MRNDYWFCSDDSYHGHSSTKLQKVFILFFCLCSSMLFQFGKCSLYIFFLFPLFSEWGASLLVSLCDTRLSCNDMLSSITGACRSVYVSSVFSEVYDSEFTFSCLLLSSPILRTPVYCVFQSAKLSYPNDGILYCYCPWED